MSNIYYSPEKFGLSIFGEIEREPDYDFDKLVVWKDEEGNLFYGTDSGYSYPSPFEDYDGVPSLIPVNKDSLNMFYSDVDGMNVPYSEKSELKDSVRRWLNR